MSDQAIDYAELAKRLGGVPAEDISVNARQQATIGARPKTRMERWEAENEEDRVAMREGKGPINRPVVSPEISAALNTPLARPTGIEGLDAFLSPLNLALTAFMGAPKAGAMVTAGLEGLTAKVGNAAAAKILKFVMPGVLKKPAELAEILAEFAKGAKGAPVEPPAAPVAPAPPPAASPMPAAPIAPEAPPPAAARPVSGNGLPDQRMLNEQALASRRAAYQASQQPAGAPAAAEPLPGPGATPGAPGQPAAPAAATAPATVPAKMKLTGPETVVFRNLMGRGMKAAEALENIRMQRDLVGRLGTPAPTGNVVKFNKGMRGKPTGAITSGVAGAAASAASLAGDDEAPEQAGQVGPQQETNAFGQALPLKPSDDLVGQAMDILRGLTVGTEDRDDSQLAKGATLLAAALPMIHGPAQLKQAVMESLREGMKQAGKDVYDVRGPVLRRLEAFVKIGHEMPRKSNWSGVTDELLNAFNGDQETAHIWSRLVGATSPTTPVPKNTRESVSALVHHYENPGVPMTLEGAQNLDPLEITVAPAKVPNINRALANEELSGDKVEAFSGFMVGKNRKPIDVHTLHGLGTNKVKFAEELSSLRQMMTEAEGLPRRGGLTDTDIYKRVEHALNRALEEIAPGVATNPTFATMWEGIRGAKGLPQEGGPIDLLRNVGLLETGAMLDPGRLRAALRQQKWTTPAITAVMAAIAAEKRGDTGEEQ